MSSESPPKPQEDPLRQQPKGDPPPQQEAPRSVNLKRTRSVKRSGKKENIKRCSESNVHIDKIDTSKLSSSPPQAAAAAAPPPPPPAAIKRHQEKSEMLERKKSGTTTEIAIASLYNRTTKKNYKVINIYDNAITSSPTYKLIKTTTASTSTSASISFSQHV